MISGEWINRNALFEALELARIPVTRTEREIINAMPTVDQTGDDLEWQNKKLDATLFDAAQKNDAHLTNPKALVRRVRK